MKKDKTLLELCKENRYVTDKFYFFNKTHSYIENIYEELFSPIRSTATNVLEIGMHPGGTHLLWADYFDNAVITGIDIDFTRDIQVKDNILQIVGDAYSDQVANSLRDEFYDVIIDDGIHTLDCAKKFLSKYITKLKKKDSVLILEDIQDPNWIPQLQDFIPEHLQEKTFVDDLREMDNRYDSIVL